ncbi:hypothetical protein [Aestuariibaculum marinum]|uniref:Uncharacterized protein n=1 Tax=Aestuariibaculum marinum TaxID=2683592 RepID=A0A8J6PTW5_9FLAO|nr:hypothetical protein [Aestuariibaculum marinum]MBD0824164.1 hypothetical protein [Aestuariibaculum marinum]
MKQYKILAILFAFTLAFCGCEDTNDNLVGSRGVAIVPIISNIDPAFYTSNLEASYVEFNVDLEDGDTVDAAEVQVTFNGETAVLQDIESFPATITIPALDAIEALGISESDVEIDDFFLYHVVTTKNGVSSRSTAALKVFVTCEFDPALASGSYHVVSEDWEVEGDVTITADPNNPFLIGIAGIYEMEGGAPNDNILYLNINPSNFNVTGEKTLLGPSAPWGAYTNYYYTPTSGLYKSCTGTFEMSFAITVDEGSFGSYNFVFTKN